MNNSEIHAVRSHWMAICRSKSRIITIERQIRRARALEQKALRKELADAKIVYHDVVNAYRGSYVISNREM